MKWGNLLIISTIITSSLTQASTCKDKYLEEIKNNKTVSDKIIRSTGDVIPYLGYMGGVAIFGTSAGALVGYAGLPLALILEDQIEDAVKDAKLMKMVRLVNESEIELGLMARPQPDEPQKIVIPVDGKSNKEKRAQRRQNRKANREFNAIKRGNKRIVKENNIAQQTFSDLLEELKETHPEVTATEVANLISQVDRDGKLCNGSIRQQDMTFNTRSDYKSIDANDTKREMKAKNRHNNRVSKHNSKIHEKKFRKRFAFEKQLIKYLNSQL